MRSGGKLEGVCESREEREQYQRARLVHGGELQGYVQQERGNAQPHLCDGHPSRQVTRSPRCCRQGWPVHTAHRRGVQSADQTQCGERQGPVIELHSSRVLEEVSPYWVQSEHVSYGGYLSIHQWECVIRTACIIACHESTR